ncbi:MAG: divalent metal cation transporter [Sedimentisphaerales bacterium]|nr:divalent metal cation transporter [Sedimentisphaerales bacterium]
MAIDRKGQGMQNVNTDQGIDNDRQMILDAKNKGGLSIFKTYIRLSGPGWLQSGITLGGGSLSSSLYLGVLVGFSFLWLQPLAMILGIIMLSAISYVTLSTGQRPLRGINEHVSPVLGWGWLIASMMANLVWSMPQFSLGTAAIQQNVMPGIFGGGPESLIKDPFTAKLIVVLGILAICIIVTLLYDAGGKGVKIFEYIIKAVVSMIVLCFIGVVVKLSMEGKIVWGEIFSGLIPDFSLFVRPSDKLMQHIDLVGDSFRPFWTNMIVSQQRDVMISAAATAVGINMTFLLPYSMLKKGWDKHFRGLAIFDLSTGLFIPFVLATGCVVIASSSQFHGQPAAGLVADQEGGEITSEPAANLIGPFKGLLKNRLKYEIGPEEFANLTDQQIQQKSEALPWADKRMAAMLVTRDSFNLADTLAPLTGDVVAQYIFGFGVLGMAISTAMILMTINGLCFCELLNKPPHGWPMKVGTLMVSIGALGPFYWKNAATYLAIPTSVFGMVLLPIAYFAFFLLMNQKRFLGENTPMGVKRIIWNALMIPAAGAAAFGCVWSLWSKLQWLGIGILVGFIALCIVVHFVRKKPQAA